MLLRSKISFPLLAFLAILAFSSCGSKTNKEGRYVPSNAAFVLHLNGKSLDSKLPWEEIKKSEMFKELYADSSTPAVVKSVMENPENSGIDVKNDILLFVVRDSSGGYVAVEGALKDAAKFKQFNLSSLEKSKPVESEKDGIHFINNDNNVTASWKDDKFVYVMEAAGLNSRSYNKYAPDAFDSAGNYIPTPPLPKQDLNALAAKVYALKEDNSLGKDEKFTDLVNNTGDIHFWMNFEAFGFDDMSNMPGGMEVMRMINLKKLYQDSRAGATIDFANGKINIDFISYSGKEMTELVKKYSGDKIDASMLRNLPSKNIAGFFALNFKPQGIIEYLKLLGLEGFANMGTAFLGFNLDDFVKANKGDIMLAVTDISKDSNGRPNMSVIFSASIGDKASFDKLIAAGKKLGKDKFGDVGAPQVSYNLNDKYFAIGNVKQDIDRYIAGNAGNNSEIFDKVTGSSSGAYINIQYILKSMSEEAARDSIDNLVYLASLKVWDNFIATGTGFHHGGSTSHMEINFVDKSNNSLKQLHEYLATIAKLEKSRQKARIVYNDEPQVVTDTAITVKKH